MLGKGLYSILPLAVIDATYFAGVGLVVNKATIELDAKLSCVRAIRLV